MQEVNICSTESGIRTDPTVPFNQTPCKLLRVPSDFSSQSPKERASACLKILIIHRAWRALPFFFFFFKLKKAFPLNRNQWKASWTQQEDKLDFYLQYKSLQNFRVPTIVSLFSFIGFTLIFQDHNNLCSVLTPH